MGWEWGVFGPFELRWLRRECTTPPTPMVSWPVHHFKSTHSKDLQKIGTDHQMKEIWVPWITWQVPNRNIHVNRQWCAWETNFYLNRTLRFEGAFFPAASITLTNIYRAFGDPRSLTGRNRRFRKRDRSRESPIWVAGDRGVPGKVCSPACARCTAVVWKEPNCHPTELHHQKSLVQAYWVRRTEDHFGVIPVGKLRLGIKKKNQKNKPAPWGILDQMNRISSYHDT